MYRFAKPLLRAEADATDAAEDDDDDTAEMADERRRSTDTAFLANMRA
jgi:hypothetical protein